MACRTKLKCRPVSFGIVFSLSAIGFFYVFTNTGIIDTFNVSPNKIDQPKDIPFRSTKDKSPSFTGKEAVLAQKGGHHQGQKKWSVVRVAHKDNGSTQNDSPTQVSSRQRFLDFAKEDILHTKPPTYIPKLKNPCWYEIIRGEQTLRCLPYFMIVGQNKCGTTDLYKSLVTHPDVVSAKGKEPQFWARFRHCYCCGNLTYDFLCSHHRPWTLKEYISYFNPAAKKIEKFLNSDKQKKAYRSEELITGEATPSNLWDNRWWWNYRVNLDDTEPPAVTNADYIHHLMPDLKIIIILRDPVVRLYSDYLYVSKGNRSAEGFHQEVVREINSFQNCRRTNTIRYCVFRNTFDQTNVTSKARLQNGFYAVYIEEYMKLFPREQFHITRLEDYGKNKSQVMKGIFHFLDLRDSWKPQKKTQINSGSAKRKKAGEMLPETKTLITDFYRPYTQHLADLLNDTRFLWLD